MARDAAVGSERPNATQAAAGSAQSMQRETSPWTGEGEHLEAVFPFHFPGTLPKGEDAFKHISPESFYILLPTCSNSKALTQGAGCHLLGH